MAARIVAILNQKGGVGKTTTVYNLGAALARRGERVLLVDADPQCSLSQTIIGPNAVVALDPRTTVAGLFTTRLRAKAASLTRPTEIAGLSFWAGSGHLGAANTTMPHEAPRDDQRRLFVACKEVREDFETILIDCHPDLHLVAWAALVAATGLVVPIQPEDLGVQGIAPMSDVVAWVRRTANPRLALLGFLVSMYQARYRIHREFDADLRQFYAEAIFATRVIASVEVKEATTRRRPVLATRPGGAAAQAFVALAAELVTRSDAAARAFDTPLAEVAS